MAVWLVRAGRHGQNEDFAIERRCAVIGWDELPDLSGVQNRDEIRELLAREHPEASNSSLGVNTGQVWKFCREINEGDLIVLPLKTRSVIAIGRSTGAYEYKPQNPDGARHTRPLEWLRTDIPRSAFDDDLLNSFNSLLTVSSPRAENAEERIRAILEGRAPETRRPPGEEDAEVEQAAAAQQDLEENAADQIRTYMGRRFRGHELARVVGQVLQAQGYQTRISPAGPDGGVDVIAGRGPMGFDSPRLCVQVKSSDSPLDVGVLRELQGVMRNFGAEQGLLVSWGGFKQSVLKEARQLFFEIRLWDAGNLVAALLENYERLPDDLQAELPLKRIWTLVQQEAEG